MRLLVTGGCGFIGSNFIRDMLTRHEGISIVNLDLLTYAGNRQSLADVEAAFGASRYRFVRADALADLENFGIQIDPERNAAPNDGPREISTDKSQIKVFVVPTNEELAIARKAKAIADTLG